MSIADAPSCDVVAHIDLDGVTRTVVGTPHQRVFYYSKTSQAWLPVSGVDARGNFGGLTPFKGTPTDFIGSHAIKSMLTADQLVAQHPLLMQFHSLRWFTEAARLWDEKSEASKAWKACSDAGWPVQDLIRVGKPTQRFVMPDDRRSFTDWFKKAKTRV